MTVSLNPVLARELKERMRTRRAGVVLTGYLGVLALILYLLYRTQVRANSFGGGISPLATAAVGRSVFEWLLFFVVLLVCFLVPGLTSAAIVGERERRTLVSMQLTLLRPISIAAGKLLASLAYLSLLVVATLPFLSVSFLLGGVTLTELLKGVVMVLVTGVVLASVSLACSALTRRVQTANLLAYGLTLLLVGGTFVAFGFEAVLSTNHSHRNTAVLAFNPLVATADAVAGRTDVVSPSTPLSGIRGLVESQPSFASGILRFGGQSGTGFDNGGQSGVGFVNGGQFGGQFVSGPQGPARLSTSHVPFFVPSLVALAAVSIIALGLAVRGLRLPAGSDRT